MLATVAIRGESTAQHADALGTWSPPFNHNNDFAGNPGDNSQSNPYSPWGGAQGIVHPIAPPNQFLFPWPLPGAGNTPTFNAVHMALIPKGRYRGMVLVWDLTASLGTQPTAIGTITQQPGAGEWMSFQRVSIIDPADAPTVQDPLPGGTQAFRYRNFFVPVALSALQTFVTPTLMATGIDGVGLFCSGHTWTPFGDLVVLGGTAFDSGGPVLFSGTNWTHIFNPRLGSGIYPSGTLPMYPGFVGLWQDGPDMERERWYATGTLTHRISRTAIGALPPREAVLIAGGSRDDDNVIANPWLHNPGWNKFEAFLVNDESSTFGHNLSRDEFPLGSGIREWDGPGTLAGTPPPVEVDWFEEYPRLHLLSNGEVLFSSYAPRWARMNHENPLVWTRAALQTAGVGQRYTSNWFDPFDPSHVGFPRHDGTSILFPNFGGQLDVVVRLLGSNEHFYLAGPDFTTPTMESLTLGGSGEWQPGPDIPTTHAASTGFDGGRNLANVVILPTGDLLLLHGVHSDASGSRHVYKPQLFTDGVWITGEANPVPSKRGYHSTAILLPDGRVFCGGANDRDYDYEIFSPWYMDTDAPRPTNLAWQAPAPPVDPTYDAHVLTYDTLYKLQCAALPLGVAVERVVLTSPASLTHHSDMHARYIELKSSVVSGTKVTFSIPISTPAVGMPAFDAIVPRGLYMLWLVTNTNVPSEAIWVVVQ